MLRRIFLDHTPLDGSLINPSFEGLLGNILHQEKYIPMGGYGILYENDKSCLHTGGVASCTGFALFIPKYSIRVLGHTSPDKSIPFQNIFSDVKNEGYNGANLGNVQFFYSACPDSVSNAEKLRKERHEEIENQQAKMNVSFVNFPHNKIHFLPDKYFRTFINGSWDEIFLLNDGTLLVRDECRY